MARISTLAKGSAEQRILATAASLFANFGYQGVSTRDIAAAAEVNEVTIYRHYPRKRDLYLAVLDTELQQVHLRGDLLAQIAEAPDGRAALTRTFELIVTTLMTRPQLVRLVQFSALELSDDLDPLLRRHLGELIEVVARYLDRWVSRGELHCISAKSLVFTLIAIVLSHRSLYRVFSGDAVGPEDMFESYAELFAARRYAEPQELNQSEA